MLSEAFTRFQQGTAVAGPTAPVVQDPQEAARMAEMRAQILYENEPRKLSRREKVLEEKRLERERRADEATVTV